MRTYRSPEIWGAIRLWPSSDQVVSDLFDDYSEYSQDSGNVENFKAVVMIHSNGTDTMMSVPVHLKGEPQQPPTSIKPRFENELVGTTHDVVDKVIAGALESTARTQWHTFTSLIAPEFWVDVYEKGKDLFRSYEDRDGLLYYLSFQSFQTSYIEATRGSPVYNSMKRSGENLICEFPSPTTHFRPKLRS